MMGDMDSSTRSTDHMLAGHDDADFSMSGISLSSLGRGKDRRSGSADDEDNEPDNRFSNKPSKSNFDHLIPKKHHNKLNRLHKPNPSSAHSSHHTDAHEDQELESSGKDSTIGEIRFKLWEGKNKFLCGGRLMMGVHSKHLIMTTVLLIATNAMFVVLLVPLIDLPYLLHTSLSIGVLNLLFLFLTAFTEPGIIPRRPPSKLLENMSADAREKMQYCHTCRIVRPPRAKHCRYCDNCVEVFDHHCPWTGTCIGVRNYRYFFMFVILTVLSAALCCGSSVFLIVRWAQGRDKEVGALMYVRDTIAPLLSMWTLMVFCLVGALMVFHLFLMGRAQTTNEFLRGVRPVNRKLVGCWAAVCGGVPPSKLLPMHLPRTESDDVHDENAVAYAISSLRSAVESHA